MVLPQTLVVKALFGIVALIVAFTVGFDLGSDREKAKQLETLTQAQADSKDEVIKSQNESIAVEGRVRDSNQRIETIKDEAVQRVVANEPKIVTKTVTVYKCPIGESNDSTNDGDQHTAIGLAEDDRRWTFDNGTVRLLNSARTNDTNSTASIDDVTDSEPSNIGVSELVSNDLDVVAKYHDLAERHTSLQNFIKSKQDDGMMFCKQE